MAVLRAATGLQRDDPLHLDLGTAPPHAYLVSQSQQLREVGVRKPENSDQLIAAQTATLFEHPVARGCQDVGHGRHRIQDPDGGPAR